MGAWRVQSQERVKELSCLPLWGQSKCQSRTSCLGWVLVAGDSGSAQVSLTIPDSAWDSLRLPWPCVPGRRRWAQRGEAMGGQRGRGDGRPAPSVCRSLSLLSPSLVLSVLCPLVFLPLSLALCPASQQCLCFSLISLSSSLHCPLSSSLSVSMSLFSVAYSCFCQSFPFYPTHFCLSVCLSPLPPTPSQPRGGRGGNGHDIRTPSCPRAKAKHPALLLQPLDVCSPSSQQP